MNSTQYIPNNTLRTNSLPSFIEQENNSSSNLTTSLVPNTTIDL